MVTDQVIQQQKHLLARMRVDRAGRLVDKNDGRLVWERARHRDALALPAGLVRQLVAVIAKSGLSEQIARPAHVDDGELAERAHRSITSREETGRLKEGYATTLITLANLSNSSPTCASDRISGGDIASVSPTARMVRS